MGGKESTKKYSEVSQERGIDSEKSQKETKFNIHIYPTHGKIRTYKPPSNPHLHTTDLWLFQSLHTFSHPPNTEYFHLQLGSFGLDILI